MYVMTLNCIHFSANSIKISPPPPSRPISPLHPTATPPSLLTGSLLPNLASNVCFSCLSLPVSGTIGTYTTNSCLLDVTIVSAHPLSQQPWVSLVLLHGWNHRCRKSSGFSRQPIWALNLHLSEKPMLSISTLYLLSRAQSNVDSLLYVFSTQQYSFWLGRTLLEDPAP